MREEHAGGDDVDRGDAALVGDGAGAAGAKVAGGGDDGAGVGGFEGVLDADGDAAADGGVDGLRVEHLCAEVGGSGGLVEGRAGWCGPQAPRGSALITPGTSVQISIVGADGRAEEGRAVITAAAAERGDPPVARLADEARHHGDLVAHREGR